VVTRLRLRSPWDGHVLLLHSGEGERQARTTVWVRRGLELGECVLHADGPEGARLLDALTRRGVDVDAAVASGLLVGVCAERLADPGERRELVAEALEAGYPGVRLEAPFIAERPVLIPAQSEAERDAQELCRPGRVSVLCRCDRTRARGTLLRSAVASHPDGVRAGILSACPSRESLILSGEADMSVADVLAAALHAVIAAARGVAWLDVADLRFLDVAGARALVHATRSFRADGGTVVLLDARPPVRHVLHLLGLDALGGFTLLGPS
jgi:anti-anti-sigma factor